MGSPVSKRHEDIATTLQAAGFGCSGRQVARWDRNQLGPTALVNETRARAHWERLASLMGRGRSVRWAAIRLGLDGYPCEALRGALIDAAALAEFPDIDDVAGSGSVIDQADRIAAIVDERLTGPGTAPHVVALRAVATRLRRSTPTRRDQADSGEMLWQSLLSDLAGAAFFGLEPLNPELLDRDHFDTYAGAEWSEIRHARRIHDTARQVVERQPLATLCAWLAGTREVLLAVPCFQDLTAEDLDTATVVVAPFFAATVALGYLPMVAAVIPADALTLSVSLPSM